MVYQDDPSYGNWLVFFLKDIFSASRINLEWLSSRQVIIREYICIALLSHYYSDEVPSLDNKAIFTLFVSNLHDNTSHDYLQYCSAMVHLSTGNLEAAQTYCARIQDVGSGYLLALQATFAFLNMNFNSASKLYRKALAKLRKQTETSSYYFDTILGFFHAFCVIYIEKNVKQLITNAANYHKFSDGYWAMSMNSCYELFYIMGLIESGDQKAAKRELQALVNDPNQFIHPLLTFLYQLISYMMNKAYLEQHQEVIYQQLQRGIQDNQGLAVHLFYELLAKTDKHQQESAAYLDTTPTFNAYDLRKDDRANLIEQVDKFDVVICSYGLLQHNGDLLVNKSWETIVLDEAQAIKNAQTQRWKTVMKLKGQGRIALSGTPIENHLGELWSIFSFINPGLLGFIKHYKNKYSLPIETKQSPDRIHALRALVQPYILRRIKSDVLKELPPKTEQTIHVEPTEQESTFYEALRRTTEERMKDLLAENDRIKVLTEITKLRQACCDSSLVDRSLQIENSKLNTFIETVKNIIENGHKALVFSQFVSFLEIIKKRIEAENIHYQYLDGGTSAANRKKAVEVFQGGEGDIFLLSLKASGSGLNLTAADYVIHMDPWWNAAVEDQASDRAHRIGQERPVTIYRLVMRNTIEEKIIALHEHKRNLANELLSGQGISGKLSNDDLMNLISAPFNLA